MNGFLRQPNAGVVSVRDVVREIALVPIDVDG